MVQPRMGTEDFGRFWRRGRCLLPLERRFKRLLPANGQSRPGWLQRDGPGRPRRAALNECLSRYSRRPQGRRS
jgi:hypothetical protein